MKTWRLRVFGSLALALLTAIMTYLYLKKDYISVVVAKADILPLTPITEDMIEFEIVPQEYAEFFDGLICNKPDIVGWVSNIKILKGDPIIRKKEFVSPPKWEGEYIPFGYCVVSLEFGTRVIAAEKGDIVDLYLISPSRDGLGFPILKELDNDWPPENLRLEGEQNGYVFRDVTLYNLIDPEQSVSGATEVDIIVNKNYQDLLTCSKKGEGRWDIAFKGFALNNR